MTAFPCVAVTPNTRNTDDGRTAPTVTWMVVDQPADLEVPCERCDGIGEVPGLNASYVAQCPSCGGTGRVVRVYAAEEQCRHSDGTWGQCDPSHAAYFVANHERRQVVRWQATTATLYPVVTTERPEGDFICLDTDGRTWLVVDGRYWNFIGNEPWAADLRPGQTVLRLDGWQPVNPPITETWGDCDTENYSPCDEGICIQKRCGQAVPLSVPSGTITRIEVP